MICVALIFLYMLLTSYIIGAGVLKLLLKGRANQVNNLGIVYTGIVTTFVYAQMYSIFAKVGLICNCIMLLLGLFCAIYSRKEIGDRAKALKENLKMGRACSIMMLFLLFVYGTSRGIIHYDTSLYHAQSIRWIEEYGAVKGLGNLHSRLAYNSAEFAWSALYSFSFLGISSGASMYGNLGQSFHCGAGFLAFLLSLCCGKRIWDKKGKKVFLSDFVRIFAVYYLLNIFDEMISPASDYFMVLTVFYIVITWLDLLENEDSRNSYEPFALLSVLGVLVITIKLSGAFLLLLAVYPAVLMCKQKKAEQIGKYLILGSLVLLPWLIRGILLSGWLVYPVTALDLFNVPWKIPRDVAIYDAREIMVWGRGLKDVNQFADPFSVWFPNWFAGIGRTNQGFMLLGMSGVLVWVALVVKAFKDKNKETIGHLHLLGCINVCFLYWMLSAPLIRYGCVFLYLAVSLNWGSAVLEIIYGEAKDKDGNVSEKIQKRRMYFERIFCVLLILIGCYKSGTFIGENVLSAKQQYPVLQKDYETFAVKEYNLHGVSFYYPEEGDQTGYHYFPASPVKAEDIFLGDTIKDGFKDVIHSN